MYHLLGGWLADRLNSVEMSYARGVIVCLLLAKPQRRRTVHRYCGLVPEAFALRACFCFVHHCLPFIQPRQNFIQLQVLLFPQIW